MISDFDANLTIKTNDIDRINSLNVGKSITLYTDDNDINSARVYSYEDAKSFVVKQFMDLLNKFILDCRNKLGSNYYSSIDEIESIFNMISKEDILRSGDNLSMLEKNVKNIINSVKKIKNDRNNYGAIKTTTGSSKELAVSNTSNRIKGQGGNFPGAADTAKVCSFVALCVFAYHASVNVGGKCKSIVGAFIQSKVLGP